MTAKDPEKGVKEMWEELDALYNLHILTAEERVKEILKKPKVAKENSSAHILLMADLKTLWREAEEDDMERQLDRPEIVRDIVMGRIPYMADDFYTKEGKKRVKDPVFRMKFRDLLEMITLRAGTLKVQGLQQLQREDIRDDSKNREGRISKRIGFRVVNVVFAQETISQSCVPNFWI